MFRGINSLNIDAKGRFAMPTRYRERLHQEGAGELIISIDTESRCLLLYPSPEWEAIEEKIVALPSFNSAARRIQRLILGHATEVEMDGHGRLLIPPLLREYANIEKKVVLIGQGKKFELWDETLWNQSRETWLAAEVGGRDLPPDLNSLSL